MTKKTKTVTLVLTAIYGALVTWIILLKMSTFSEIALWDDLRSVNWTPFYYDVEHPYHMSEVRNNLLIFIPLGIYFRMLNIGWGKAILYGMAFSFSLEVLQFVFALGATDITDLITNTAGAVIGVIGYNVLALMFRKRETLDKTLRILATIATALLLVLVAVLLIMN
jgi:glycopeptide antibiotics resistance protein